MNTGAISMRYARALLMFANEAGVAAKVYQEALTLHKSFLQVAELRRAMATVLFKKQYVFNLLKIQSCAAEHCCTHH